MTRSPGCPIVPGSSLKGKLRTLLARRSCVNGETLPDFSADGEVLLRMFGSSEPVRFARLQFADAFLLNYDQLKGVGVTEVKSENTINRLTSKANPRQIERVIPYPETLNVDLDGIRQTFKTEVEEYELFSTKAGV